MGSRLRDRCTPQELAASGQIIEINEKIGELEQLPRIIEQDLASLDAQARPDNWRDATLCGTLRFHFADAQGRVPALEGQVAVTADAVCQRCLKALKLPLEATLRVLLLTPGQAVNEFDGYDAWELEETSVRPLELVEEALIMAMPFAAMHADDCVVLDAADEEETTKPFADLRRQMQEKS